MASFLINATTVWNKTGYHVKAGRKDKTAVITVDASSRWTANSNRGLYSALGAGHPPGMGGYKAPNSEEGCLVGMIDNTAFQFVFDRNAVKTGPGGKTYILQFPVDKTLQGEVLMGINDEPNGFWDNGGQIHVLNIKIR